MKLSNQQLEALVSEIYNTECKKSTYNEDIKKALNNPKNKALAKKYYTALMSIPENVRNYSYNHLKKTESEFLNAIVKLQVKEPKEISKQDIRNKVLIASIESETLTQLQTKLKIKF